MSIWGHLIWTGDRWEDFKKKKDKTTSEIKGDTDIIYSLIGDGVSTELY